MVSIASPIGSRLALELFSYQVPVWAGMATRTIEFGVGVLLVSLYSNSVSM
jgi:hypothetical protein